MLAEKLKVLFDNSERIPATRYANGQDVPTFLDVQNTQNVARGIGKDYSSICQK